MTGTCHEVHCLGCLLLLMQVVGLEARLRKHV